MRRLRALGSMVLDTAAMVAVTVTPALFPRLNPPITVREHRSTQRNSLPGRRDTAHER